MTKFPVPVGVYITRVWIFSQVNRGCGWAVEQGCQPRGKSSGTAVPWRSGQPKKACGALAVTLIEKKKNTIATAAVGGGVLLGNNTRFLKTRQFSISKPSPVSVSEIGFLTSQLGGIRISYNPPKPLTAPFTPAIQPLVARRICPFTGKKANRANKVSFSNHKTKKLQFVNLQYKRVWWEAGKRYVKLRLSTKALKTKQKNGLDAVAKKAGIDLRKE
ncbi:50S ribosomal protein L28, chloroplastic-like [Populus trichocarpa]|nr:50S ribosomal protein L28, chloroplastic-like [Populus trichocarpa]